MKSIQNKKIRKAAPGPIAQVILEAGVRLAARTGLSGVTIRAVAAEAEVAPSAIGYYYTSLAGLLTAIAAKVDADLAGWRTGILTNLKDPSRPLFSAEALSTAALLELLSDVGRIIILQQEIHRAALRGFLTLGQAANTALTARDAFWQELLLDMEASCEQARIRGHAVDGLLPVLMLDRCRLRQIAMASAVMGRLDDRLARRPISSLRTDPVLTAVSDPAKAARGKHQIIEAAMRLIGEEGIATFTHRKVAARSGLSLASTTYFYASKEDLIADAFAEIQRRAVHAIATTDLPRERFLSSVILDQNNEERWEMAAMLELNHAAIRSESLASQKPQVWDCGISMLRPLIVASSLIWQVKRLVGRTSTQPSSIANSCSDGDGSRESYSSATYPWQVAQASQPPHSPMIPRIPFDTAQSIKESPIAPLALTISPVARRKFTLTESGISSSSTFIPVCAVGLNPQFARPPQQSTGKFNWFSRR